MADWRLHLGGVRRVAASNGAESPAVNADDVHVAPIPEHYVQETLQTLRPPAVSFRDYPFPSAIRWEEIRSAEIDKTPEKTAIGFGVGSINHLAALLGDRATSRIDRNGDFHDFGLVDLAKFFHDRQRTDDVAKANDIATKIVGAYVHHHRLNYQDQLANLENLKGAFDSAERSYKDLSGLAVILVDKEKAAGIGQ